MSIRAHGGVLRLTDSDFEGLVRDDPGRERAGCGADWALGVPGVPEALEAARSPLAVLHVAVAGRRHLLEHRAWVGRDTVALLLDVHEGERQLMALPPALLASGLARLLKLGPRKHRPGRLPREVEPELLADLFAETEILRLSAFDTLDADRAWSLGLTWPEGDRWTSGVDDGDGSWLVAGDEAAVRLEPSTSTDVWRRLTTLLAGIGEELPVR